MKPTISPNEIAAAHRATIYHEEQITKSTICTCFYCGYQFDPRTEDDLDWTDEHSTQGRTLLCPLCHVDCILGDASGFPVTDPAFINACTEAWFDGYSRISDGKPVEKVRIIPIEVE